ncbi:MAG: 16S rRNA (cytosine(967)-C(5))-methyltransferase RsmB [Armatimonadota bacterium]|nr:16S rRNA (cytosine(967)-C(5))-methyltransferase RsmB [Armatimonadota bacterium]
MSAREAAFRVLLRAEAADAFVSILLYHTLDRAHLSEADRSLATAITLGVLRHRARLDVALGRVLQRSLADLPVAIRTILRMGAFQLLCLTRVPAPAAVSESVALARRHGHVGTARLVNAVLRRLAVEGAPPPPDAATDPVGHLAVVYSHPRWLVERWMARWGVEGTQALAAANVAPAPSTLRVNTLVLAPGAALVAARTRGIEAEPGLLPEALRVHGSLAQRLPLIDEGLAVIQDEGAMLVARALDPQPDGTVIDACAGLGGKTTHLAALMGNRGRVIACDVHPRKLQALAERAARMRATCIEAHHLDARDIGRQWPRAADAVLVDAPCSGLGTIRRRPEIKWRVTEAALVRHAEAQTAILAGASGAVRPGGTLVYSVCSLEPEEGPAVVEAFLARHPEFARDELPQAFPRVLNGSPLEETRPGEVYLWPHRHDTDGFYIARLRRR